MHGHPNPCFCACCVSPIPSAPTVLTNRPGLSAISYRIGTFATFRQAMLESIAREPALAALTTRESDDHAVTLFELFALMGDVLTFYNERIANELYLRTARERDSVLRLVRLIGYQLSPGLAAKTLLTFTLDANAEAKIRRGLKTMTVPGQDEHPQIFETDEEIVAHADLNAVPVFVPPIPFNGFAQSQASGPVVSVPVPLSVDDRIVMFGVGTIEEKTVASLEPRPDGLRLSFTPPVQSSGWNAGTTRAAKIAGRLRFFGYNAPPNFQRYDTDPTLAPQNRWKTETAGSVNYRMSFDDTDQVYPLDVRYDDLKPGTQLLVDAGVDAVPRLRSAVVTEAAEGPAVLGPLADTVSHIRVRQTLRGTPVTIAQPGSHHEVVARNGTGAILLLEPPGPPPRRWQYMGGSTASEEIAAVSVGAPRLDLFVRDAAMGLQQRTRQAGGWNAWVAHGGILTGPPAVLGLAGGGIRVFVRGLLWDLWVLDATSGLTNTFAPLGGVITSPPTPVTTDGIAFTVFVRGWDRQLWQRRWTGAAWVDWEPLGGVLAGRPVAAAAHATSLDVVIRADDGRLMHRHWDGTAWSEWLDLGGAAEGDPAIVATVPDRIDVFVRGRDDAVWQISRTGTTWGPWTSLGGRVASTPSVARDAAGLHLYARGSDGAVVSRSLGGTAWGPWLSHGDGLGAIPERRATRIYRLVTPDIAFRDYAYPDAASGGRLTARLPAGHASGQSGGFAQLKKGRRIMLQRGITKHVAVVSAALATASHPGELEDQWQFDFSPPLPAGMGDVVLVANVAEASHGETQPDEVLGNGDTAKPFQKFVLQRAPVTYLPSEKTLAGKAALEIRINGDKWQEAPSLYGSSPRDRIYTARQSDEGLTTITFGDGRSGARLPTGPANVVARYRKGTGLVGRAKIDQISIALERPPGLRAVTNPFPAEGAADPERLADARTAAPNTVRTFGRAVSLQDFESLAVASGLVARAHVTWVWHELAGAVHLTVAAPDGAKLSGQLFAKLYKALASSRDPNHQLLLANLVRIPFTVRAKVLRHPDHEADAVAERSRQALLALFAFEAMPLGRAVHASHIYTALQAVQGVVAVDLDVFHLKGHAGMTATELAVRSVTADPVQPHVRIYPARPTPADPAQIDRFVRAGFEGADPPPVLAAEQAYIADPASDIDITVVEAL